MQFSAWCPVLVLAGLCAFAAVDVRQMRILFIALLLLHAFVLTHSLRLISDVGDALSTI